MYLFNLFWISLRDLFNKFSRLFFLSLGVAVGTCALTFLLSLQSGLKKVILDEIIQQLPFNQLKIRPVSQKPKSLMEFTFKQKDESLKLTQEKLEIVQNIDGVKDLWPERTLNFPILFTLKEVKVSLFTVPDITMPTTIFGVHPDILQHNPELYKKFKYNPDINAEIPIVCSSKLFEMMNDTSLAQGKVGDLLSSIVNEGTFRDKPLTLSIGFSTREEKRIKEGFDRAKRRESRIKKSEVAGIAKFLRKQFTDAFSEGYETDRPWFKRKARIVGFTDEVPIVGLSIPLQYVEEWLKIRANYELDHYYGAVLKPKEALPKNKRAQEKTLSELKKLMQWIPPQDNLPEQRIVIENNSRIRLVDNPFTPALIDSLFRGKATPLDLQKPNWDFLSANKNIEKVLWEYTSDFPSAIHLPKDSLYIPIDLHGIDPEILGEEAKLLAYKTKGNDPVPTVVSPKFFQRIRELGLDLKNPKLYEKFKNLESLKGTEIYVGLDYDPEKLDLMNSELKKFIEGKVKSKPAVIFRKLKIVAVSDRVPDIGFSVPKAFIERAYRWKYPKIKQKSYRYSGISILTKNVDFKDKKNTTQLEKAALSNFQMPQNSETTPYLKWYENGKQLSLRSEYWSPKQFNDFFNPKETGLQLRGGSFTDYDFKSKMQHIYLERRTNFPIKMELIGKPGNSRIPVALSGIHSGQLQDKKLKEIFAKKRSEREFVPILLSKKMLQKLQHFQLIPKGSPWESLLTNPEKLIGTRVYFAIGDNLPKNLASLHQGENKLPPQPLFNKDKITHPEFVWKGEIVGFSEDAAPLGLSIPAQDVEDLIRWYYPVQLYERYSGVTVITKSPENTASVAKAIRDHPMLKLDIKTGTETAESLTTMTTTLRWATGVIAFILFVVAGVSIFNGLTLSVLEQSKKIGIYRAIGATRSDIVFIFMVESIAVGLLGGCLGILSGFGFTYYFDKVAVSTVPDFAFKNIKVWDVTSGKELETLSGQPGPIHTLAFSPDGIHMASGSPNGPIKIWDMRSKTEARIIFTKTHSVSSMAFSTDGKALATGAYDKTIKIWDIETGKELKQLTGPKFPIHTISWSSDNKYLAAGTFNGEIWVWEVENGLPRHTLSIGKKHIYSVCFSPDGKQLATGGSEGVIQFWDLTEGKLVKNLSKHTEAIHSLDFSPDGKLIASGSLDHTVKCWEIETDSLIQTFREHKAPVWSVAFSQDGKSLISGSSDKTLRIRDLSPWFPKKKELKIEEETEETKEIEEGPRYKTLNEEETRIIRGHTGSIYVVAPSPNNRMIVTGSDDATSFFQRETHFFTITLLVGILISIIASVGPSLRAAHITPADVLRDI